MTSKEIMESLCPVKINEEYKKNARLQPEDITELQNWLLSIPEYPHNIPDGLLAIFMDSSNYNIEDAKKYLEISLKLRAKSPEIFANRDPRSPPIKAVWETMDTWMTQRTTVENCGVLYAGILKSDPSNFDFINTVKACIMVGEAHILKTGTPSPGIYIVVDAKGSSYRHVLKSSMRIINDFLLFLQEGMACRIIEVHVININAVVDKLLFLLKPLINRAHMGKVFFHTSDLTEFFKHLPKEIFPPELGGTASYSRKELLDVTLAELDSLRDWFIIEEELRQNNKVTKKDKTKSKSKK